MEKLLQFKRNAVFLGLCDEYKKKWDACGDKQALVDMALDSNGVEFMADSIAFGWGLSKDFLLKEFGDFTNGKYQCHKNGYTSEMYIGAHGVIEVKSTLILVAYCTGIKICIPEHMACKVYICGGSNVCIENQGRAEIYVFGSDNHVMSNNHGGTIIREKIPESQWAKR